MAEVMSVAVTEDDQWLVANGRPVEYYAGDTAFVDGEKVWAADQAARRLAEALDSPYASIDFVAGSGFPDGIVSLTSGERYVVHGDSSLQDLGLRATDPSEIAEDELIILARELVSRAQTQGDGVEPLAVEATASV